MSRSSQPFGIPIVYLLLFSYAAIVHANQPPTFINDMNLALIKEDTAIGTAIYQLQGEDAEGDQLRYGLKGTDSLRVNETTGIVSLAKNINYETTQTLNVIVTLEEVNGESRPKNKVEIPVNLVILDVNDNSPKFAKESYDVFLTEESPSNSSVLKIEVSDEDVVGSRLSVSCRSLRLFSNACSLFRIQSFQTSNRNYTGNLILQKQLNYSKHQFLQFLLVSWDGLHETVRAVSVFVSPTRVPPPQITGKLFAIINESLPANSLVMKINASIPNKVKGRLVFSLLSNPHQLFGINSQTGEIRTATVIDREAMTSPEVRLKIQVQVNEDGRQVSEYTPSASTAEIPIIIRDVNDHAPAFNHHNQTVYCDENVENGFELQNLDLMVKDADVSKSSLSISLIDPSNRFEIEPKSAPEGWATVKLKLQNGPIDFENINQQNFTLLVIAREDSTFEKLSSTSTIVVKINDLNDNAPAFQLNQYDVAVEESAPAGTLITTITAKDKDGIKYGSSSIRYSIRGFFADYFALDQSSGELRVSDKAQLDYESKRIFHFIYLATDADGQGRITTVPLTVHVLDADDHWPQFARARYDGVIRRGQVQFTPPLIIHATDKDIVSKIKYKIARGNDEENFRIDSETGEIFPTNSSGLYPNSITEKVELVVEASDGSHSVNATVSIEIQRSQNDIPNFDSNNYTAILSEMAISGTFVQQISAEVSGVRDSKITYQILGGGRDRFKIGASSGIVTVGKGAAFDFERQKRYAIEIMAVDESVSPPTSAMTTLHVQLEDVNNRPPFFDPPIQTAQVFEDAKLDDVIYKINASDPDTDQQSSLKYFFDQKQAKNNNSFAIDENSGEIRVIKALSRREQADVLINVLVVDTSAPIPQTATGALFVTIMKVNRVAPSFPSPWTAHAPNISISIIEEQAVGSIVHFFVAIDEDSDISGYSLVSDSDLFEISNSSGVVITKNRIDYERVQEVTFRVVASDSGIPQLSSTVVVTATVVNVNDNDPEFNSSYYAASIKEHSAVGTHVVNVSASDKDVGDFGRVTYKLIGEQSDAFTVDVDGVVRVKDPSALDREKMDTVTFYVMAEDQTADGSQTRSASVPIVVTLTDINDHKPKFNQREYAVSIMDNILVFPPTPIIQLTATDDDQNINGLLTYSIIDGNSEGIFLINTMNGMLFPNVSLVGRAKRHVIKILARDVNGTGPNYDLCTVTIEVEEGNANSPRIISPSIKNSTIYVEENLVGDGFVICTLFADDPDAGKNGQIQYFIKDGGNNVVETKLFSINAHSGQLRLNEPLDREQQQKHNLILVARDNGVPRPYETLQQVLVVVKDVNDNEPQFPQTQFTNPYTFEIKENLQVGALVGQIEAFDLDADDNTNIYYYIVESDEEGALAVDKLTGSIYTNRSLDYESKPMYHLTVTATNDQTGPKVTECAENASSCVQIHVYVVDVNDNAPVFLHSPYTAGVHYEAAIGHQVADVSASDPDTQDRDRLVYSIEKTTLFSPGTRDSAKVLEKSPFRVTNSGHVLTEALVNVYKYDHFKLVILCKEAAPSAKSATTTLEIWIYDSEQLTQLIVEKRMDDVKLNLHALTNELSNVTEGVSVVAEMKEKVVVNDQAKDFQYKTEVGIFVIDPKKRALKGVRDVMHSIAFSSNRFESQIRLSPLTQDASGNQFKDAHDQLVLGALVALCATLFIGIILVIVTIKCMRRILLHRMHIAKLRREAFEPPISSTENPLWIEQAYEEQEIGLSVLPGQANLMGGNRGSFADPSQTTSNEAMYATIRRNARSTRDNLRAIEQSSGAATEPPDWHFHSSTLPRDSHRNVCHVSPTPTSYLPAPTIDIDDYCQSVVL